MEIYFIGKTNFSRFYERINQDYELYVPIRIRSTLKVGCSFSFNLPTDDYLLKRYSRIEEKEVVFNEYRSVEPVRGFFTYAKDEVCDYFNGTAVKKADRKPIAISGIKNCDLFSLKVQDFVFLGGNEPDSIYRVRREEALIISGDCPSFKEACFCRAFDINPHASEGFDFNLSPIKDGYLVEIGSDKAKILADSIKELRPVTSDQLAARSENREAVIRDMEEHLKGHKIPNREHLKDIVLSGYDSQIWDEQMRTCVECGGCVFICDTCHCFLLSDEKTVEGYKKVRNWDGCLYKNFTKVAGGANPLRMRYMRLRNRYLKKFDFFIDNLGFQACCGCGRCIEVCPGKIDIRYILRRLYEEKHIRAA